MLSEENQQILQFSGDTQKDLLNIYQDPE